MHVREALALSSANQAIRKENKTTVTVLKWESGDYEVRVTTGTTSFSGNTISYSETVHDEEAVEQVLQERLRMTCIGFSPVQIITPIVTLEEQEKAGIPALWKVGDVFLDRYEVKGKLGEGGMGIVYKVYDHRSRLINAVKSPRPEFFARANDKENFIREAQTWLNLGRHPHIVSCLHVQTLGGIPRLFADYVDGGSLADWIRMRRLYQGGAEQSLSCMLDIAIQFAWGLGFAHEQGVVHQDVKPANVMMTADGIAKVTDFGLAKAQVLASEQHAPPAGQSILVSWGGMTLAYCSPEQAARRPLSRKTDIWSWAVSVLQMFVGGVSWQLGPMAPETLARSPRQNVSIPAMPPEVRRVLRSCLQPRPEERPASMLEVAADLQALYERLMGRSYPRASSQPAEVQTGTLYNRACSFWELGKHEEALACFEQVIQLDPGNVPAQNNVGYMLQLLGRYQEALAAFEQTLQLDPMYLRAYTNKGNMLRQLGRHHEGDAAYEQYRVVAMDALEHNRPVDFD